MPTLQQRSGGEVEVVDLGGQDHSWVGTNFLFEGSKSLYSDGRKIDARLGGKNNNNLASRNIQPIV